MTFAAPFSRVIARPFGGVPSGSAWWLSGGIAAANCVAAYQAKGAASYAASKVNLANPGTYNAADGETYPTWSAADGWVFTSDYLTTGILPANLTYSYVVRFSDQGNSGGAIWALFGTKGTGGYVIVAPNYSTGFVRFYASAGVSKAPAMTGGIISLLGNKLYRNGTYDFASSGSFSPTAGLDLVIGGYREAASVATNSGVKIQAISIYDKVLSDAENTAVMNAMNAL